MAEHGLAQQGGRFNILYAEHRTEKTISGPPGNLGPVCAGWVKNGDEKEKREWASYRVSNKSVHTFLYAVFFVICGRIELKSTLIDFSGHFTYVEEIQTMLNNLILLAWNRDYQNYQAQM
jgi:hypothetical protein